MVAKRGTYVLHILHVLLHSSSEPGIQHRNKRSVSGSVPGQVLGQI
jgi:hypothetical protein